MTKPTTGVLLFAYNTDQINYVKLAIIAAKHVKENMPGLDVCLVTDSGTWDWFSKSSDESKYIDNVFDDVVLAEPANQYNKRVHYDSPYTKFTSDFKNGNKHKVFEYTPYDRTLLIDIDYIIQNNDLQYVFDTDASVRMFYNAENLIGEKPHKAQQFLHETGIPMFWSTVLYFDKHNPDTKVFFELWDHIQSNYDFYKFLYSFPGDMYRTDFCVSIAAHIMNGMNAGDTIDDFGHNMIYMSQRDDIAKVNGKNDWVYLVNDRQEEWKNSLTRITNENVHVMNKRALDRQFDDIMQSFGDSE